jgi:hypothetical protein
LPTPPCLIIPLARTISKISSLGNIPPIFPGKLASPLTNRPCYFIVDKYEKKLDS